MKKSKPTRAAEHAAKEASQHSKTPVSFFNPSSDISEAGIAQNKGSANSRTSGKPFFTKQSAFTSSTPVQARFKNNDAGPTADTKQDGPNEAVEHSDNYFFKEQPRRPFFTVPSTPPIQQKSNTDTSGANTMPTKAKNNTGLPDNLKTGIENLSGYSMNDVQVHRNSDKPAELQAHAYAQGTDIHLASGQEKHLPHEAWHVVQQKQGRVRPTMQLRGKVNVNDDVGLEKEADVMGGKAASPITGKRIATGPEQGSEADSRHAEWYKSASTGGTIQLAGRGKRYRVAPAPNQENQLSAFTTWLGDRGKEDGNEKLVEKFKNLDNTKQKKILEDVGGIRGLEGIRLINPIKGEFPVTKGKSKWPNFRLRKKYVNWPKFSAILRDATTEEEEEDSGNQTSAGSNEKGEADTSGMQDLEEIADSIGDTVGIVLSLSMRLLTLLGRIGNIYGESKAVTLKEAFKRGLKKEVDSKEKIANLAGYAGRLGGKIAKTKGLAGAELATGIAVVFLGTVKILVGGKELYSIYKENEEYDVILSAVEEGIKEIKKAGGEVEDSELALIKAKINAVKQGKRLKYAASGLKMAKGAAMVVGGGFALAGSAAATPILITGAVVGMGLSYKLGKMKQKKDEEIFDMIMTKKFSLEGKNYDEKDRNETLQELGYEKGAYAKFRSDIEKEVKKFKTVDHINARKTELKEKEAEALLATPKESKKKKKKKRTKKKKKKGRNPKTIKVRTVIRKQRKP